eukprot:IDg13696t1
MDRADGTTSLERLCTESLSRVLWSSRLQWLNLSSLIDAAEQLLLCEIQYRNTPMCLLIDIMSNCGGGASRLRDSYGRSVTRRQIRLSI